MSGLLAMLNNLVAAWLTQQATSASGVTLNGVELDPQGGLVALWVERDGFRGEALLRVMVEAPRETRYTVRLAVERWPEKMPPALEPLRKLLDSARLQLDFDLGN